MKDELHGWVNVKAVSAQCSFCKNKLTEGRYMHTHAMAACEYGQPWFPHAVKCVRYEPEDLDE